MRLYLCMTWKRSKWKFIIQMFLLFECLLFRSPLYEQTQTGLVIYKKVLMPGLESYLGLNDGKEPNFKKLFWLEMKAKSCATRDQSYKK